jgi:twitching motility two-component system response regulator PilH
VKTLEVAIINQGERPMAQILIVDDSPTEAHVLKGMLEKHGFQVETAENGTEGIERAKELKPDLILMDVVMPGLNGFQATRQLTKAAETSDIPVIIVTTKDQEICPVLLRHRWNALYTWKSCAWSARAGCLSRSKQTRNGLALVSGWENCSWLHRSVRLRRY